VVAAGRSLGSVIALPVSSQSPRQGNSPAESVPSMVGDGDPAGVHAVLTRPAAALCPVGVFRWSAVCAPPNNPRLLMLCMLLVDHKCENTHSQHTTSMDATCSDRSSVYAPSPADFLAGGFRPGLGHHRPCTSEVRRCVLALWPIDAACVAEGQQW
jgi:hypothetical protein